MLELIYDLLMRLVVIAFQLTGFMTSDKLRKERLGYWDLPASDKKLTWFHGASLGEINSLKPIIYLFKVRFPNEEFFITTNTETGRQGAVEQGFRCFLLPLDDMGCWRRALGQRQLRRFVFAETEIWPNLIKYLKRRNLPLYLVNARMSEKSFTRFRLAAGVFGRAIAAIDKILIGDKLARERFIALGALQERVKFIGNAKYDKEPAYQRLAQSCLKKYLGERRGPILTLANLRPEEEEIIFPTLEALLMHGWLVIVAPRHPQCFTFFGSRLSEFGIAYGRISNGATLEKTDCLLLDNMGVLEEVLSISDLAFIGGTLVDGLGGHNPLEAASYGCALIAGPFGETIYSLMEHLKENGAVTIVNTAKEFKDAVDAFNDHCYLQDCGAKAKQVSLEYKGAAMKILNEI